MLSYADDLVVIMKTCEVGETLEGLYEQCRIVGMEINKTKTQMLRIYQKTGRQAKLPYNNLCGIYFVEEYKYLGVRISSNGTIIPHMKSLKEKIA